MAIDVLCDGVDDDVSAQVEGLLHVGRQESVVHYDEDAVLVGDRDDMADVDEAQRGVGGRFDPDEARVLVDVLGDVDFNFRGEGDFDAVRLGNLREVAVGAAVDVRYGDDVGSGGEGLQDVCGGSRTGREGEGVFGVLEGGDGSLEVGAVGVCGARVFVVAYGFSDGGLGECGGQ